MKNIISLAFMTLFFLNLNAQELTLTPHKFTKGELTKYQNLKLSKDWFDNSPVYAAKNVAIYALHDSDHSSIKMKIPKKTLNRIKNNPNIVGFYHNGTLQIFNTGKGLIKEIPGIRVIAGDV